jgi:hypothetical protein
MSSPEPHPQSGQRGAVADTVNASQKQRFAVFHGITYYPEGGWNDHGGTFDTLEQADAYAQTITDANWLHIVDLSTGLVVRRFWRRYAHGGGEWVEDDGYPDD